MSEELNHKKNEPYSFEELNEVEVEELISLYKTFGDGTRLRILAYLPDDGDGVSVSELAESLRMSVSAVSHQLRILKQNKLIRSRRFGRNINYQIADGHVRSILNIAIEHILHD